MDGTHSALILIAGAFFVAMVVERLLEILMATYTLFEVKCGWYQFWNTRAKNLQKRLHDFNMQDEQQLQDGKTAGQLAKIRERAIGKLLSRLKIDEPAYADVPSLSAEKVRQFSIKFIVKIIGALTGISIAILVEIDMFALIDQLLKQQGNQVLSASARLAHQVLTGIAMGLGSAPLHKIIVALEKAKQNRKPV